MAARLQTAILQELRQRLLDRPDIPPALYSRCNRELSEIDQIVTFVRERGGIDAVIAALTASPAETDSHARAVLDLVKSGASMKQIRELALKDTAQEQPA